jgi:hypothetical protein
MPADRSAKTRAGIAFFFLFVFMIVFSVGAYFVADLDKLRESAAARESQAALQDITDPAEIDGALSQHPANKFLQMMAMATRAATETNAAIENLSSEIEPPAIAKAGNLGTASRSDLEALRGELKTAEANATAVLPRTIAVLKTERDSVDKYALSLHLGKEAIGRLLDRIDERHADIAAFTSRMLQARADFYHAYANYVSFLIGEFGVYKTVNGEFIFPFQRTVDRYNVTAQAMMVAAKRVAELEEERKKLVQSQQEAWLRFVKGSE